MSLGMCSNNVSNRFVSNKLCSHGFEKLSNRVSNDVPNCVSNLVSQDCVFIYDRIMCTSVLPKPLEAPATPNAIDVSASTASAMF